MFNWVFTDQAGAEDSEVLVIVIPWDLQQSGNTYRSLDVFGDCFDCFDCYVFAMAFVLRSSLRESRAQSP